MNVRRTPLLISILITFVLMASPAVADGQWVEVTPSTAGTPPSVDVHDVADGVAVDVDLAGFFVEERSLERGLYSVLVVPEFGSKGVIGEPQLPFKTVLIPVANGPAASLRILEADSLVALSGVIVMPQQAPEPDCGNASPEFVIDDKAYGADRWFPSEAARIADDVVVRGQRFLIVEVNPLAFNPARKEVSVRPNLRLIVDLVGEVNVAAEELKAARQSAFFPTAADLEGLPAPDVNPTGIEYLIIVHDTLAAAVQPLAEWKQKKGFTVETVAMSTIGTTSAELKGFLQTRYDTDPDLTYVLLVGDHPMVPSEDLGGMVSDLYYSCLDGSDYFPDIVMGRIAVQVATDCDNVIDKILAFDRDIVPGAWHGDFLMAALLQDYDNYNCEADRWFFETGTHAMHFIRDHVGMGIHTAATTDNFSCGTYQWRSDSYPHRFSGYAGQSVPQADADLITSASQSTQDIADAINGGVSLVQHRDHGGVTGWGDPPFYNANVAALTNGTMTPVVYSINCQTGAFNSSGDCFAEAFMKKYPGGAVGVIAATANSYSGYNDLIVHGSYDSFWDDYDTADGGNIYPHSFRPAEAYLYGRYYMYHWEGHSSYTQLEFELFHWHGDPEMRAFTAIPVAAGVTVDSSIPVGASSLTVTVDVEGAMVAVTESGILLGRAEVSGGVALVAFDPVPQNPSTLDVVVTGHNLVPWQGTVEVIVPVGPWLVHSSHVLDDSSGNGDGIANPGETIVISVNVENVGADDGTGITGVLSSGSAHCVVTDPAASFPDAVAGATVTSLPDHFSVQVAPSAVNGDSAALTLDWTVDGGYTGSTVFSVAVCEPLIISDVTVEMTSATSIVNWTTNLPTTSVVAYGTATPLTNVVESTQTVTAHSMEIAGLEPCTSYLFEVSSTSPNCYTTVDDNGGSYYSAETSGLWVFLDEDFDSDPGWTISNGTHPSDGWAFGVPTGQGQDGYGGPDPTSGATGDNVYGVNLDGDIPPSLSHNELKLTTPVMDLTDATTVVLRFQRWLGVEGSTYDHARILLSVDAGVSWQTVWENGSSTIDDNAWGEFELPLPGATGQSEVQIQWAYGATDGYWNYCGWNIDDVVVEGDVPCGIMPMVFIDGFESGDTSAWSSTMP